MSKLDFFIFGPRSGGIFRVDLCESEVLALLDQNEAALLQAHPVINPLTNNGSTARWTNSDHAGWRVFHRSRKLRQAIQQPKTPAWEVAALAMEYANWLTVYSQPEMLAQIGAFYGERKQPRLAKDELAMKVMRYLRRERGMSWLQTFETLEDAAHNQREIARVEIERLIERDYDGFTFRIQRTDQPDQLERFAVTTLKRKKFGKA